MRQWINNTYNSSSSGGGSSSGRISSSSSSSRSSRCAQLFGSGHASLWSNGARVSPSSQTLPARRSFV